MTSNVTIYSKDNCVQCRATMRYLDKHGVPYDVKSADEHAQMLHNKGFTQAPVVATPGVWWQGLQPELIKVAVRRYAADGSAAVAEG